MDTSAPPFKLAWLALALAGFYQSSVYAFTANIAVGTRAVFLRVGDGAWTGAAYNGGGTPGTGGGVSVVQTTVAAAAVGNGTAQGMTASARLTSDYDGFAFCSANQIYLGGFFRLPTLTTQNATLTASAPLFLLNSTGDQIPVNQISWTSTGNGDTGVQPIPAGVFSGGNQVLANNFVSNTWRESCHSFSYANQAVVPAGTYNMRVTYTLATP